MRLLQLYFLMGCLLVSAFAKAQDTLSYSSFKKKNKDQVASLKRDTITVIDSIKTTSFVNEINRIELKTASRDSVVFQLEDEPFAARLDSLWRNELARMDLFDSINNMVHEQDYKEEVYLELPTDTLKKRLARINERTPFNVDYNTSLESVIHNYLKRHKPSMERMMEVSQFYFPMFEETLDKYDIPLEMKYLAIVESALRPRAKSRVGATGLWQFMFTTGKMYGLDVNSYVDERMDPIKATEAACQYLSKLYDLFGDWDLALASYNSGPGNVSKAIRRSGGYQNYWNLRDHLPRETAGYVPAFLATMYLFEYAEEHGYQPKKAPVNYFQTDTVHIKQLITLEQVAKITDEPLEVIQFLNPSYKLDIIPVVEKQNYYLRLPAEKIGAFVQNEEDIYAFAKAEIDQREKPLPKFTTASDQVRYRVRSGDYLGKIANKYGVGVSQIKKWNNLRSNNLRVGQRLTIYPRKPVTSSSDSSTSSTSKTVVANGKKMYIVKEGDSLWKIANKFPGVSVKNIEVWNDISSSKLKPGMKLVVSK